MLDFIYELVVGLLPRLKAADNPGVSCRKVSIKVPLDKHVAQESFHCLVYDGARAEHPTLRVPQVVPPRLDIDFDAVANAVISEVWIVILLVADPEVVLTFEEVVDVGDEGTPLTNF